MGRRTSKTGGSTDEHYHYSGDKVSYVTNASGSISQIFTYDGAGRPLYLHQDDTLYQYHFNGHGDVIILTNMTGAVVAEYTYDAWGNITSKTGTLADSNPYRYAGYWYDKETGLYHLNARYYKSDIGRFISQDTWMGDLWEPSSLNLYVYVGNDPISYIDPTGHKRLFLGDEHGGGGGFAGGGGGGGTPSTASPPSNPTPPSSRPGITSPGPHAAGSVPARGPGRNFSTAERQSITKVGETFGCHSCGAKIPGTKSGNFILDHQPPSALSSPRTPQALYPHCVTCSARQGGIIRALLFWLRR